MKIKYIIPTLIVLSISLSGCNVSIGDSSTKPSAPSGLGYEFIVEEPSASYPLPFVDNAENNSLSETMYTLSNPVVKILYGFDGIWSLNDPVWQNGEAGSSGPDSFENVEIRNSQIWGENIAYVLDACNNRTDEESLAAYYDAVRGFNYSIIDGFGPLTNAYKTGSGASTTIDHSSDGFDVNEVIEYEENDEGADGGDSDSTLGAMYDFIYCLRSTISSTSGAKYFYSSPRPWRMNDLGEVVELDEDGDGVADTETIGDIFEELTFAKYQSNVEVIPALKYARKPEEDGGAATDGAFPSGHTNAGYLAACAYAYAVPERFSELLTRASQMGESRIMAGMHSPLDVIGGRIQALAVAAAALSDASNDDLKNEAYSVAGEYFGDLAEEESLSLYEYAHTNDTSDWADHDYNKALYRERMTYGFSQIGTSGLDPIVPKGAETLLETRQPYLSAAQRRAVLYTTEVDSGYPVLDASNGWGRLDYVTAADGYGAFLGDVTVFMDASDGRFSAHDWWRNDIGGNGLLTKQGDGTLTLTGENTYTGGTVLEGGVLEAESHKAFGTGDVYVKDGILVIAASPSLVIGGNFTMDDGTLSITMDEDSKQIAIAETLYLDGGDLDLDFSSYEIKGSHDVTLITADAVSGTFDSVTVNNGYTVTVSYENDSVTAHIE